MYQVSCIKCKTKYDSEEDDDFYCPECLVVKNEVAKKIDAQMLNRPKKDGTSLLKNYDSKQKIRGFISAQELLNL